MRITLQGGDNSKVSVPRGTTQQRNLETRLVPRAELLAVKEFREFVVNDPFVRYL